MQFVLHDLLKFEDEIKALSPYAEVSRELVEEILDQAAKFAEEVLFPLNQVGDKEGCHFHDGEVTTSTGFKEAYRKFCEAGWPSIVSIAEYGGQGLPHSVGIVFEEMLIS